MRTSVVLCSLLALVAVSQVAAYEAKVADATARINKEADRVKEVLAKRMADRLQGPFDKASKRATDQRTKADTEATAQVKRVHDKAGNYAKCAVDENTDRTTKVAAAVAASTACAKEVSDTIAELTLSSTKSTADVLAKVNFDECKAPATNPTARDKSDALRCVDQRAREWLRLMKEVERSWLRVLGSTTSVIVQRGQRCQAKTGKPADDAIKALRTALVKCERETGRTTVAPPPPPPAPAPAP